jgi:predicted amidohydrolase YtcJ
LEKVLSDTSIQFLKYKNRLKFGGIKITGDGSPQGKTAFFTKPYVCLPGDDCNHPFRGMPSIKTEVLDSVMRTVYQMGYPIFMHCNGDATADMFIESQKKYFELVEAKEIRSVVIHAQFSRQDQLKRFKELNLIPSFFSNH